MSPSGGRSCESAFSGAGDGILAPSASWRTRSPSRIHLHYDADNTLDLTWQKVAFQTVEIAETDQILTPAVACIPMYDASNGILTGVTQTTADGICQ